nr:Ig-like domain-containing protein [Leucobacter weissii]
MNGDGYADIAVGDLLADNNGLSNSGSIWIIAGAPGADDVNVQSGGDRVITRIDGQNAQERLSNAEIAGDVNGDGADDLLLSSYVGTPWGSGSPAAGAGYIVFGGDNAPLHLSTDLGERGFAIAGPQRGRDRLGVSSAPLGDINGDRIADLVIGADGVSYPDAPRNGGAAVVLGARSNAPVITDPTGDPSVYSCADGAFVADCAGSTKVSRGYWINGPSDNSGAGSWVSGLSDLNGDGRPDIGIGAVGTEQVFAVYSEASRTAALELSGLAPEQGEVFSDTYNSVIGEAGDFDGNGVGDVIISGTNAVSVVLRGALQTGLEVTGDEAASVGDTVELTVTARSLLPSAQPEFAGTVRVTVNGEPASEAHEVRSGGDPISIEVPATTLGSTTAAVEFTPDDPNLFQPASAEHTIDVGLRDDGAGTLALDRSSAQYGDPVTAEFATAQELTGEVEFRTGERVLGTAAVVDGAAAAELAALDPGSHEIVAHYLGDDVYGAFSTATERLEITRSATSIGAPTLSKSRAVYGTGAVTATVRVVGADGGTVTFTDNGRTVQRVPVSATGTAVLRLAKPAAGTHRLRAKYDGSGTRAASALGAATTLTVSKARAKSISVSGKRFTKGTTPRVTVRVGKLDNGAYPVGKVRVQVGSVKKTVSLSAAKKGRVTVKLTKKYRKGFSVTATFLPKDAKNVAKATSKKTKVRVR